MTEQELCDRQRENGNSELYLLKRGTFWRAYDGGAFALARVTGYQVKRLKTMERYVLGFNLFAREKVLEKMRAAGMIQSAYKEGDSLITFSGGDPTPDSRLVTTEGVAPADNNADYQELKNLRKELLNINLADESLTLTALSALVRNLQMRCLASMSL